MVWISPIVNFRLIYWTAGVGKIFLGFATQLKGKISVICHTMLRHKVNPVVVCVFIYMMVPALTGRCISDAQVFAAFESCNKIFHELGRNMLHKFRAPS